MIQPCADIVEHAVRAICPEIEMRVRGQRSSAWCETDLRRELACCILSSQVHYETAFVAASRLADRSLLYPNGQTYAQQIEAALLEPLTTYAGVQRRYRFPRVRARHLASTFEYMSSRQVTLQTVLKESATPSQARARVVEIAQGCGPKQASMFLRNTSYSFDLAILDRHVMRYMVIIGIISNASARTALTLHRYMYFEEKLKSYSRKIGWPVGYVDWAVWIVMRAVREESRP